MTGWMYDMLSRHTSADRFPERASRNSRPLAFNPGASQMGRMLATLDGPRAPRCPRCTGKAMENRSSQTPLTAAGLTSVIHRFHPSQLYSTDDKHASSVEAATLREHREAAQEESGAWNTLLQRIHQELPGYGLWELPFLLYDPCRCVRVSLATSPVGAPEQKAVVLLASILAPVHHLYASQQRIENGQVIEQRLWHPPLPLEYQPLETRLDSLAQSVLGTSRLPHEVLFAPVPGIQVGNLELGNAHLIHCLFTDRLW
jgi:hypothetical protein